MNLLVMPKRRAGKSPISDEKSDSRKGGDAGNSAGNDVSGMFREQRRHAGDWKQGEASHSRE